MLHHLKTLIRDQLGVPPWAVLVVVGCIAHIVLNVALRRPIASAWGLLGPVGLGVAIEGYEIWVQYKAVGLLAPGNDPLLVILGRHSLDVVFMLAAPMLLVAVSRIIR